MLLGMGRGKILTGHAGLDLVNQYESTFTALYTAPSPESFQQGGFKFVQGA